MEASGSARPCLTRLALPGARDRWQLLLMGCCCADFSRRGTAPDASAKLKLRSAQSVSAGAGRAWPRGDIGFNGQKPNQSSFG